MQRLEVNGAVRRLYGSLGVKGLMVCEVSPVSYKTVYGGLRHIGVS